MVPCSIAAKSPIALTGLLYVWYYYIWIERGSSTTVLRAPLCNPQPLPHFNLDLYVSVPAMAMILRLVGFVPSASRLFIQVVEAHVYLRESPGNGSYGIA